MVAGGALLWLYFRKEFRGWLPALVVLGACAPALWLSVEQCTQFLVIDESRNLREVIFMRTAPMRQWSNGSLRTTDMTLGSAMNLVRVFTRLSTETYMMIAKALHWLSGIGVMVLIYHLLAERFVDESKRSWFAVVFWNMALLLPVSLLALKVFNYDLLSMVLGAYALLLMTVGISDGSRGRLVASVVVAALAAQEKLIASPILWLTIFVFTCREIDRAGETGAVRRLVRGARGAALAVSVVLGVMFVSYVVLLLNRVGDFPSEYHNRNPIKIFAPLISVTIPVLRAALGGDGMAALRAFGKAASPLQLLPLVGIGGAAAIAALVTAAVLTVAAVRKALPAVRTMHSRRLWLLTGCVVVSLFAIGVIATYTVSPYWAPAKPLASGAYVPPVRFNNFVLHFGATSLAGHLAAHIGYAFAVFFNAVPTVIVVVALLLCLVGVRGGMPRGMRGPNGLVGVVALTCLFAPLLYGLSQTPVANRYFNLFIFLPLAVLSLGLHRALDRLSPRSRIVAVAAVVLGLVAEIAPFRPVHVTFRPWWSNYPRKYQRQPIVGRQNPWGVGWGEELLLAGRKVAAATGDRLTRVYYHYYGQWISHGPSMRLIDVTEPGSQLAYTENDYYVFNRLSVTQGWLPFPRDIEPLMTVSFRGFVQAWIYRGDQLRRAGFSL